MHEPVIELAHKLVNITPKDLAKVFYVYNGSSAGEAALKMSYHYNFIADEIMMGFGRTGKMFPCEYAEISPDFMRLSEGLTGGCLSLSVVMTTNDVYNAFYCDYSENKAFLHLHSYTGNPLVCSAALATLKIFEQNDILGENEKKSSYIK